MTDYLRHQSDHSNPIVPLKQDDANNPLLMFYPRRTSVGVRSDQQPRVSAVFGLNHLSTSRWSCMIYYGSIYALRQLPCKHFTIFGQ